MAFKRVTTGVPGLDTITLGGLFEGSSVLIFGPSGCGKTILGTQIAFHHVRQGGRVVFATILTETHGRMLGYLRPFVFFDDAFIPDSLTIVSAYQHLMNEGTEGFLHLVHKEIRDRRATMLVIDGFSVIATVCGSPLEFQKYIQQLTTLLSASGCTVLLLANSDPERAFPEHGMVDTVIELCYRFVGLRTVRQLAITKLRGSGYLEGRHLFRITDAGLVAFPRLESLVARTAPVAAELRTRDSTGIERLDAMLEGGLLSGSTTSILGAPGAGKTLLGLSFLAAGARAGQQGLYFGFYETPPRLIGKADAIGLKFGELVEQQTIDVSWRPPFERFLDELGEELLDNVRRRKVRRLFIDGIDGLRRAATFPERLVDFFTAMTEELRGLGVTTVFSEEMSLFHEDIELPIEGVSAMIENIIVLRYTEHRARLHRLISILKVRETGYDHSLREFTISSTGIEVAATVDSAEAVLAGGARSPRPSSIFSSRRSRRRP
ncbi:ATPase domain-containing protein [Polyangium spumosum]|uniref:non-specific serine/threonine protein kinase n=1 Tax=Polyangium spumosum TaxID=889282 RepID=A0A6N7PSS2_9BACT|nr:ATPase domain-containing protein [Polyangium spumosum]MRG95033.1 hypothetical protein [Polyangium spumosum]